MLERNLYGLPSASRGWGHHRDKFILKRFNQPGWSCAQSVHDPCLFVIDRHEGGTTPEPPNRECPEHSLELPKGTHRSWVLIHTDDCDAYGTSLDVLNEINDAMHKEWATELVDNTYVLGVKRSLVKDTRV